MAPTLAQRPFFRLVQGLIASVGLFISTWHRGDILWSRTFLPEVPDGATFDFIVVGGGSAGAVVANRLSEKYSVLLVEAGGSPPPVTQLPIFSFYQLNNPIIDWVHKTVPQKNACLALDNQESGWSQGKVLGGTSVLNFLIHSRGHPKDFQNWARITGDQRWSYEGVLPFFKRSETYVGSHENSGYHGRNGPLRLENFPETAGSGPRFVRAAQEFGYPKADINGNYTQGFDTVTFTVKDGRRQDTYSAYIRPILQDRVLSPQSGRGRLSLAKWSLATKVLVRGNGTEAYGIEYFSVEGQVKKAYATKEVILSAGSMNSPKLLMLSGIGPKSHLESHGIKVKVDTPAVGQNLQDHISTYLGPFFVSSGETILLEEDLKPSQVTSYFASGKGLLSTSGVRAIGFFPTENAKSEGEGNWPDIQLLYMDVYYKNFSQDLSRAFHIRRGLFDSYYKHAEGKKSFLVVVSLARPVQRGDILLRSKDPKAEPLIDPKYLQNERDIRTLVEGVKKTVEMVETAPSFREINARFTDTPFPGCESTRFRSDEYWECYIRHLSITLHHIVGTCAMGRKDSPTAVVDAELRVLGARNLRVIDSSVMPTTPVGNTNAAAIMIGEKGADFILKKWSKRVPT